jgi:hypothetical protein
MFETHLIYTTLLVVTVLTSYEVTVEVLTAG